MERMQKVLPEGWQGRSPANPLRKGGPRLAGGNRRKGFHLPGFAGQTPASPTGHLAALLLNCIGLRRAGAEREEEILQR